MPIEINNENSIENGLDLIKRFVEQDMNPFFKFWNNITKLLPWLEVEYQDFGAMNRVFLQDSVLKKSILWYLTDHPEKLRFIDFHINRLNDILKERSGNKTVKNGLSQLIKLKEVLEKETPEYNWNPEYVKMKYDG